MEPGDPQKKRLEDEKESEGVPAEWFDAYLQGNLRIPQTGLGIHIMLGDAFLKTDQNDLETFLHSKLSGEQIQKLGMYMNRSHKSREIPRYMDDAPEYITPPSKPRIPEEQLQDLWIGFILTSTASLMRNIRMVLKDQSAATLPTGAREVQVTLESLRDKYGDDFDNALKIVRKMYAIAADLLQNDNNIRELSREYRDIFNRKKNAPKSGETVLVLQLKGREILEKIERIIGKAIKQELPEIADRIPNEMLF